MFSVALHSPYLSLSYVLLQARVEMFPPFEQHRSANQLEPGCEFQAIVFEHDLQLLVRNVLRCLNLVLVYLDIHICFDE